MTTLDAAERSTVDAAFPLGLAFMSGDSERTTHAGIVQSVLLLEGSVMADLLVLSGVSEAGVVWEAATVNVVRVENGQVVVMEIFYDHDLEAAVARARELVNETVTPDGD